MISPISLGCVRPNNCKVVLPFKKESQQVSKQNSENFLQSVSGSQILSQMPNVKFTGEEYYDDLSAYANSSDPFPSEVEQRKYRLSVSAAQDIEQGDYLTAIEKKIHIADICRAQGKIDDANKLMDGARRLLQQLPKYQIIEAIKLISNY